MLRHLLKMHNIVGQRSSHVAPSSSSMINRVVSLQSPLSTISFESPAAISGGVESSTTTASRTAKYPQIVKEADVNSLHRSSDYPPPKLHQPWWLEEDLNLEAADTLLFDRNGLDEPWFKPDGGRSSAPDHSLEAPYTEMGLKQMGAHISSQQNRVQKAWFTYAKESRSTDTEQLVERTQPGDRPAAGVVLDPVSSVGSYKLPSTQFLVSVSDIKCMIDILTDVGRISPLGRISYTLLPSSRLSIAIHSDRLGRTPFHYL